MRTSVVIYEDNIFLRNGILDLISSSSRFEWENAIENCDPLSYEMEILHPQPVLMDIGMAGVIAHACCYFH